MNQIRFTATGIVIIAIVGFCVTSPFWAVAVITSIVGITFGA